MEYLDIVDENSRPTGQVAERSVVHKTGLPHQGVNLWFYASPYVLMQQRGPEVVPHSGLWGASVGGHPRAGMSRRLEAVRETGEELGQKVGAMVRPERLVKLGVCLMPESFPELGIINNEFRHIYALELRGDLEFDLPAAEVAGVKYVTLTELLTYAPGGRNRAIAVPYSDEYFSLLMGGLRRFVPTVSGAAVGCR